MPLTDAALRDTKATDKPFKLFDGGGLFLLVIPTGKTWWRFRYRYGGKEKQLSFGVYPDVPLQDARKQRDEAREALANGIDPSEQRKAAKAARLADEDRQIAAIRFLLDNDGGLSFHLGYRHLTLTPAETAELRAFLNATSTVTPKVTPCL